MQSSEFIVTYFSVQPFAHGDHVAYKISRCFLKLLGVPSQGRGLLSKEWWESRIDSELSQNLGSMEKDPVRK